jgi:dienelactone hydrolase
MLSRRQALALPAAGFLSTDPFLQLAFGAEDTDPTRVFPDGKKSPDVRLGPPKTLDDNFPFVVPKTKQEWEVRRKQLREQLLVATGLWPMPEKTPLNAVVHGKIDRDEYTIEKVYFASMPGHYVSGNLYRPKAKPGNKPEKQPGVLFAHGHWVNGRLHDAGEKAARASVDGGGEPDMDRGRFFMQALPATLAKLGFVVFQYDMVGVGDSTAIPHGAGFADARAELRLHSAMGLQTWNSVRALDFLAGLPDVDAKRLGMTGASGGGTQTFMLAAIDDRLACAFPAVMVSTGMQGGCVCENCSLLRVNTGNVEIAALFAPKPMAFSCANDWTKDFVRKGYPELEQLYKLYGAEAKVDAKEWLRYGHQYNVHAREFMYYWMRNHLMAREEKVTEPAFKPVPPTELSVYDAEHPRPKDELDAKALRAAMTKASDEQMAKLAPKDAESLKEFKRVVGTALRAMVNWDWLGDREYGHQLRDWNVRFWRETKYGINVGLCSVLSPVRDHRYTVAEPRFIPEELRVNEPQMYRAGEAIPIIWAFRGPEKPKGYVVWVHPKGKSSVYQNEKWNAEAKALIDAGYLVYAMDPLGIGESADSKFSVNKTYAGYTYGYNRTLLADRVCDVLTALRHSQWLGKKNGNKPVYLVGWDEFGPIAVLAKALAGNAVAKTAADLNRFRFEDIDKTDDPMMLPGAVKYGGLGAFLALCAPDPVLVHNQMGSGTGQLSRAAYEAAGAADKLTRNAAKLDPAKVVEWLLK